MKKWLLHLTLLCLISVAAHAQKTLIRPTVPDPTRLEQIPIVNKNGCIESCPTGMSCDGACCMYPTSETMGQLNYIIYNKCNPIHNLHFKFEITKEFTAQYDELTYNCSQTQFTKRLTTTDGIVVQFNCFSKDAPNALIQYLFYVQGTSVFPHLQYSGGTPDHVDHDWPAATNTWPITLPKANSLAKGWVLEVELGCDNDGYVVTALFTATTPDGKKWVSNAPLSSLFKLRIGEFQTNIVSTDGHYVHFATGGEGTLTYSSKDNICVEGGNYEHCAAAAHDYDLGTCETSNASYGKLSKCCTIAGDSFSQSVTIK